MRIEINQKNFPDENFRGALIERYGNTVETNIIVWLTMNCCGIKSLNGIEYFTNLQRLYCDNNDLDEISLENNSKLQILSCCSNNLKKIPFTNLTELKKLRVDYTLKDTLDISKCINLKLENVYFEN